jgi:transposase-like protein
MFKTVPKEIKEEILTKVKSGEKVTELASIYGLSDKTIYRWLKEQVKPDVSLLELNKLKKENEELKRILGMVMLDLEREKKGRNNK